MRKKDLESLKSLIINVLKIRNYPISQRHLESIIQLTVLDNEYNSEYNTFDVRQVLRELNDEDLVVNVNFKYELMNEENKLLKRGYYY